MRFAMALLVGVLCGAASGIGLPHRLPAQGALATSLATGEPAHSDARPRWPARIDRPLRIFVEAPRGAAGWSVEHAQAIRGAFARWVATGIPIRLAFVGTRAEAEVIVRTVPRLAEGISGRTTWRRNAKGWLHAGHITLARRHEDGDLLTPDEVHAVALHEVGHLLGLPHVADPAHIMAPRIRVRTLSPVDQAAIRSLYGVSTGGAASEGPEGFDSVPPPR